MPKYKKSSRRSSRKTPITFGAFMRRPIVQIGILVIMSVAIYLVAVYANGGKITASLPADVNVDTAYSMVQDGAFLLDVREKSEWDEYHAPGATLIPLGQLASRLNELPRDRQIVVVCHSGNRSQQGRDILLKAGFTQVTSIQGGMSAWQASGYPTEQ